MAAGGNENNHVYVWVKNVIWSCTDLQQLVSADRLVDLFVARLEREKNPMVKMVRKNMTTMLSIKLDQLIDTILEDADEHTV